MNRLLFFVAILFILSGITSCNELSILDFSLGTPKLELHPGDTEQIKVSVSYSRADTLALEFYSADENVAIVDNKGNVTAKDVGNTIVSIACEERLLQCEVEVVPQVTSQN